MIFPENQRFIRTIEEVLAQGRASCIDDILTEINLTPQRWQHIQQMHRRVKKSHVTRLADAYGINIIFIHLGEGKILLPATQ